MEPVPPGGPRASEPDGDPIVDVGGSISRRSFASSSASNTNVPPPAPTAPASRPGPPFQASGISPSLMQTFAPSALSTTLASSSGPAQQPPILPLQPGGMMTKKNLQGKVPASKHSKRADSVKSSSSHKKKKKQGRPSISGGSSVATSGSSSRKRRLSNNGSSNPPPPGANGSSSHSNNLPTVTIRSDADPNRLVNPLIEPLPLTGAATSMGLTAREVASTAVQAGELQVVPEIVHHRPDTYPISYLARLLGFDVPVADESTPFPTPLPDISTLSLATAANKKQSTSSHSTNDEKPASVAKQKICQPLGDLDDQYTLDHIDPVFKSLLQEGYERSHLRTPAGSILARFRAKETAAVDRVLEQAESLQIKVRTTTNEGENEEWTFCDFPRYNSKLPADRRPNWKWHSHVISALPSTASGMVALCNGVPRVHLRYQFQWLPMESEGESELVMVVEGLSFATNAPVTTKVPVPGTTSTPPTTTNPSGDDVTTSLTETETQKTTLPSATPNFTTSTEDETRASAPKPSPSQGASPAAVDESSKMMTETSDLDAKKQEIPEESASAVVEVSSLTNETPEQDENTPTTIPEQVLSFLYTLAFEHTRSCEVWYALAPTEAENVSLWKRLFRMTSIPKAASASRFLSSSSSASEKVPMVCDLTKCSTRYAFLKVLEGPDESVPSDNVVTTSSIQKERLLARLPNVEEATMYIGQQGPPLLPQQQQEQSFKISSSTDAAPGAMPFATPQRMSRKTSKPVLGRLYASGREESRDVVAGLRVTLPTGSKHEIGDSLTIHELRKDGTVGQLAPEVPVTTETELTPHLEILKAFPLVCQQISPPPGKHSGNSDELLGEIEKAQKKLQSIERDIEPTIRDLLRKSLEERIRYESPDAVQERKREEFILEENQRLIARRKEMDAAWQKQLEQDMDAVCNICDDGEVTPENQILFCEACNVAVHQACYGVEEVPAGDYYCAACRYFKREKMSQALARKTRRDVSPPRASRPLPLPICCELCPVKQGAYYRCDNKAPPPREGEKVPSKWIHTACAKWQGLDFVEGSNDEIIEDVSALKIHFRRLDKACCICQSKRGAYHQCREEGCDNIVHLLCARNSGLCEVTHGESIDGPVEKDPWTLLCPEHSSVNRDELKREPVPVDSLVRAARELPWDPMPPPVAIDKPFNKMTGEERSQSLADPEYEAKFFEEMQKRFQGVKCELCGVSEGQGETLLRCGPCGYTVCTTSCCFPPQEMNDKKTIHCHSCAYQKRKREAGEEFETPQCHLCFQKGGYLLEGFAQPARNRKTYWKNNPAEFAKSLFGRQLWCHGLCSL